MAFGIESSKILCSAGGGELTARACLDCALRAVHPPCGFDYSFLKGLYQNDFRSGIHVTDLTGCLLKSYWDKTDPKPEYPHEMIAKVLGTATHAHWEGSDEHMDAELALEAGGIVGKADVVYKNGRVVDYKTTRWIYPDKLPYGSHILQVNIYAYLLQKMGREVSSLAIQYIDMSGPTKCRACKVPVRQNSHSLACPRCGNTPKNAHLGAVLVEVPFMEQAEIEELVTRRYNQLDLALGMGGGLQAEPSFLCSYCAHLERCPEGSVQVGKFGE